MELLLTFIVLGAIGYGIFDSLKPNSPKSSQNPKVKTLEQNIDIIRKWITFFGVLTIISIVCSIAFWLGYITP